MKIFKFMKIDIILCKQYLWFLLFPVFAFAVISFTDTSALIGTMYCLFGALVVASLPFFLNNSPAAGDFMRLLPARKGDDIRGHFLFSFLVVLLFLALSVIGTGLAGLIRPNIAFLSPEVYPLLFAISLIFAAAQNLLFCLLRTNSAQAQQLMRMGPPFLFFFGSCSLMGYYPQVLSLAKRLITPGGALVSLFLSLALFVLAAQVGAVASARQDH